jgi:hypothetical protein
MKLAGEAGSLLKIEEEIAGAVAEAKQKWLAGPKLEQGRLFADDIVLSAQKELGLDVTGITDDTFWEKAEERIYAALKAYAEQVDHGSSYQRRLFTDDAARGFAFIDLCQKNYDVALMNPPFGLSTGNSERYMQSAYPNGWVDLYACFIWRAIDLTPAGICGAITSRSFISSKKLEQLRVSQIIPHLDVIADLGKGVMDAANVEACAYTIHSSSSPGPRIWAVDLARYPDREHRLKLAIERILARTEDCYEPLRAALFGLPNSRLLYSIPAGIGEMLQNPVRFEPTVGTVRNGLRTFDDFRFVRAAWEVPPETIGIGKQWERFEKGGEYGNYYPDIHLVINRLANGKELAAVNEQVNGQTAQSRQASTYYYRPGAYYTDRSQKGFAARALPAGCVIASNAPAILTESSISNCYLLGWLNSRLIRALTEMQAIDKKFYTGFIKALPWVDPSADVISQVETSVTQLLRIHARYEVREETNSAFVQAWRPNPSESLKRAVEQFTRTWEDDCQRTVELQTALSELIDKLYGLEDTKGFADSILERDITIETTFVSQDVEELSASLLSYAAACAFGRFDVRFATGAIPAPELPDPFASLPACQPGQLQNEHGRPLTKDDFHRLEAAGEWNYPLELPWDGILVDDAGHPLDIEAHVHEVLQVIWKDRWEAIEREVCEILGVHTLRDYFYKPAGFFGDHLKRYSKGRQQAPIYWPLSTASGSYTLWIFYHRITDQTLHTALADFLDPKIRSIELNAERQKEEGRTQRYADSIEFLDQLKDLRAEIERIIKLPWKPNLNDGVLITASPLWKLFRLKKWQRDLKACWEALEGGKYDWAHLAFSIWPDRVRQKGKTDRSLAIAHGLEELCTVEAPKPKRGKTSAKKAVEEEGEKVLEPEVDLEIASKPAKEAKASAVKDFEARPISIDQTDRTVVLCTIRQLFGDGQVRDRDTAIRDVAAALNYQRVGPRIREVLHTDLLIAVRRGILQNQNGQLSLLARDLRDYQRDFLKENFLSAIGRVWIERADAIQAFARWLGFSRTGSVIEETGYSLINGLLRDRRLEADKSQIRRATG